MHTRKEKNKFDLIFHLGYPKCASTTLQDIVFPLTKGYSGSGIGRQKNDHYANDFKALSPCGPSITSSLKQAKNWSQKVIKFRENEFPEINRLILSSEYYIIHNILKIRPIIPFLKKFREKIWSYGDVKIIIIIRNQADRIASLYAENSTVDPKASQKGFEKKCRSMTKSRRSIEKMDYFKCIDELYQAFGRDKVCVLLMEDINKIEFWLKLKNFADLPEFNPHDMLKGAKANAKRAGANKWKIQDYDYEKRARITVNKYFDFFWPEYITPEIRIRVKKFFKTMLKTFYAKKRDEKIQNEKTIYLSDNVKESIMKSYQEPNKKLSKLLDRDLKSLGYL